MTLSANVPAVPLGILLWNSRLKWIEVCDGPTKSVTWLRTRTYGTPYVGLSVLWTQLNEHFLESSTAGVTATRRISLLLPSVDPSVLGETWPRRTMILNYTMWNLTGGNRLRLGIAIPRSPPGSSSTISSEHGVKVSTIACTNPKSCCLFTVTVHTYDAVISIASLCNRAKYWRVEGRAWVYTNKTAQRTFHTPNFWC